MGLNKKGKMNRSKYERFIYFFRNFLINNYKVKIRKNL